MPHAPDKQSHSQRWATPLEFFRGVDERWRFNLDVCAEPWSAKCELFYTKEDDGLSQPWWREYPVTFWCNPPYSNIGAWLERGINTILDHPEVRGCYLVPASTSTMWFHDLVFARCDMFFVNGRLAFKKPLDVESDEPGANFDSMLLRYDHATLMDRSVCVVGAIGRDGKPIRSIKRLVQRSLW